MQNKVAIFQSINRTIKLWLYVIILISSVFSLAKNNELSCQQIEDVVNNGQRYMQFVFADSQGYYTAGYLESYDDPSKGSLFCSIHLNSIQNQNVLQMQQLQELHTASIAGMKQHAISRNLVTQRWQVDQLFLQNLISAEQAMKCYQQIDYAPLVAQAQKKAKKLRKSYKVTQQTVPQQIIKKSNIAYQ